jgi:hypothetical protein
MRRGSAVMLGLLLLPALTRGQQSPAGDEPTVVYFVRHADVDPTQPTFPLNVAGRQKADAFAHVVSAVRFTHIFSSHTTRARQMVELTSSPETEPNRRL